jgi:predicted secreted protein
MKALFAVIFVLVLGACAPKPDPDAAPGERGAASPKPLEAPTPDGTATRITREMNGETVTVKVGETFTVELIGIPTAGYLWKAVETPAFIEAAGEFSGPTSSAQNEPGFTGGNHWEGFLYKAVGAGEGDLKFEQRRPWESDEPATDVFAVRLIARE